MQYVFAGEQSINLCENAMQFQTPWCEVTVAGAGYFVQRVMRFAAAN